MSPAVTPGTLPGPPAEPMHPGREKGEEPAGQVG